MKCFGSFGRAKHLCFAARNLSSLNITDRTQALAEGLIHHKRASLAQSITLIESKRLDHQREAEWLLEHVLRNRVDNGWREGLPTLRIGVAGPPGAGKSTFIEAFGKRLIEEGNHKIAVIPVDPTSHVSGGSILGDKTRMEFLSSTDNAYVRASPTKGVLGGIAEHTQDVVSLCECAGYDTIMIESVGLGQSEIEIDQAVDLLILLVAPGGGDDLQASKKGIMEAADIVCINKADGDLLDTAKHTKSSYAGSMRFIRRKDPNWEARVQLLSSRSGLGMDELFKNVDDFYNTMTAPAQGMKHPSLLAKRSRQMNYWMWGNVSHQLVNHIKSDRKLSLLSYELEAQLLRGQTNPRAAASKLLAAVLPMVMT